MSSSTINVFTLNYETSDPNALRRSEYDTDNIVPANVSFRASLDSSVRVLSRNFASSGDNGFLYVPDLAPSSSCLDASEDYFLPNVTRRRDIPGSDFDFVALAPWLSPECTLAYLESARNEPVRAFFFYIPGSGLSDPPMPSDSVWGLGDGGQWKRANDYPVYAIPGMIGENIMQQLALYSGSVAEAPFADQLEELYRPQDRIRLYAHVDNGSRAVLPNLWVFLLIIAGALAVVVGLTSFVMHWLQRRRRTVLRRRIANGEIDLEALGIKRLTVPQEIIDKMPLNIYTASSDVRPEDPNEKEALSAAPRDEAGAPSSDPTNPNPTTPSPRSLSATPSPTPLGPYNQPTCAICLEDFIDHQTSVRELPCQHIFHPECVDTFLRDTSSLCPMCKQSVLPKGHCPAVITNAMVRRERLTRRRRGRTIVASVDVESQRRMQTDTLGRSRIHPIHNPLRYIADFRTRRTANASSSGMEMQPAPATAGVDGAASEPGTTPASAQLASRPAGVSRTDWARQRAEVLVGGPRLAEEDDSRQAAARPRWRKIVGAVFPTLA